jgi:NTE family protein
MTSHKTITRALVLGGGGATGVAWELGILTGLYDAGVDVRSADSIIGTSAGSMVGAQIAGGTELESLFASQLAPVEQSKGRKMTFDASRMRQAFTQAVAEAGSDPKAIRARIGAYALAAPTVSEAERRAYIESWLPVQTWPKSRLLIAAVDTETGEDYIMDRASGVSLVDAVAASCAIPGIRPPVTIAGRRYMDGGMRSATNADLARGSDRIFILNPAGEAANFFGASTASEVVALEREGSRVLVITPDAASVAAIGLNPSDPVAREPSARAGRAQGRELAAPVAALWSDDGIEAPKR